MRRLLTLCLLLPFTLFAGSLSAAEGWPKMKGGEPRGLTRELTGKSADAVLRILGNLPWLPEGTTGDKQKVLYVIYSPGCSISEGLYDQTRKLMDKVQIRWIPVDVDGSLNSMYEARNAETVRNAFKMSRVPPDGDAKKTAQINRYAVAGIAYLITGQVVTPDGNMYFPTMIYGNSEKLSVTIGPAKDIGKLIASIPETEPLVAPEAMTLGAVKTELIAVPRAGTYTNTNKGRATMRLVPDKAGNDIGGIPPGDSLPLPVEGVTKNGYVAFKISPTGAMIYLEDAEFVNKALAAK